MPLATSILLGQALAGSGKERNRNKPRWGGTALSGEEINQLLDQKQLGDVRKDSPEIDTYLEGQEQKMSAEFLKDRVDEMRQRFPAIDNFLKLNTTVFQSGEGPNYSETYPITESMNPNPGMNTVEVRPKSYGFAPDEMENMLGGEVLHLMGDSDVAGNPRSPEFMALKEKYLGSLTPQQIEMSRRMFERNAGGNPQGLYQTDFNAYQGGPFIDAEIRGAVFPDRNAEYLNPGYRTPEQVGIAEAIKEFLIRGNQ